MTSGSILTFVLLSDFHHFFLWLAIEKQVCSFWDHLALYPHLWTIVSLLQFVAVVGWWLKMVVALTRHVFGFTKKSFRSFIIVKDISSTLICLPYLLFSYHSDPELSNLTSCHCIAFAVFFLIATNLAFLGSLASLFLLVLQAFLSFSVAFFTSLIRCRCLFVDSGFQFLCVPFPPLGYSWSP